VITLRLSNKYSYSLGLGNIIKSGPALSRELRPRSRVTPSPDDGPDRGRGLHFRSRLWRIAAMAGAVQIHFWGVALRSQHPTVVSTPRQCRCLRHRRSRISFFVDLGPHPKNRFGSTRQWCLANLLQISCNAPPMVCLVRCGRPDVGTRERRLAHARRRQT